MPQDLSWEMPPEVEDDINNVCKEIIKGRGVTSATLPTVEWVDLPLYMDHGSGYP
jgi:hypothetical protein